MSEHFYTLDCIFSSNFLFVVRVNVLFTICLTRFLTPYTNMSVNCFDRYHITWRYVMFIRRYKETIFLHGLQSSWFNYNQSQTYWSRCITSKTLRQYVNNSTLIVLEGTASLRIRRV